MPVPDYKIVRSNRHSLSIHISPRGDVEVRAPFYIPSILIKRFVLQKSDWIEKHLGKHQAAVRPKKKKYVHGEEFLYMGKMYKLSIGNFARISVTDTLNFPKFLEFRIEKELHEWYLKEAKKLIAERVQYYADLMDAHYKDIYFSDTISKWGSCSADNTLQFNWRLIMAPTLIIDYVIVHELVHTREKNHKDGFWRKVALYKPAYKQYVKWLREHGQILFSRRNP